MTSGNTGRDVDGKLIIQGIENGEAEVRDGAGWTISIMDPEGTMGSHATRHSPGTRPTALKKSKNSLSGDRTI